jgi:hypothetical protein
MTTEQQSTTPEVTAPEAVVAQPQEPKEAAPAAAELSAEQVEEQRTSEWVAAIREKANRTTAETDAEVREASGEDDSGEEPVPETASAAAPKAAEDEEKAEAGEGGEQKPRRALADLHAEHRARLAEKRADKTQQRLDAVVAVLQGLQQAPAAPAEGAEATAAAATAPEAVVAKAEADDPEPDFDIDPKEWHGWKERQFERRLAAQEKDFEQRLLEQLSPLIEGGKKHQQQVQQGAEAEAANQRSAAVSREVATLVDEYKGTIEGEGYPARVEAYAGYFVGNLMARGASEAEARAAFQAEALDVLLRGEAAGHHPVAYYDAHIVEQARLAEGLPAAVKPAAPAAAAPAPVEAAPAPQAPAKPQKTAQQKQAESDLAAATAAAKLPEASAGGDRDAVSAGPQEVDIRKMAQRGKVTGDMIKRVAAAQGRNPMHVIREALRASSGG